MADHSQKDPKIKRKVYKGLLFSGFSIISYFWPSWPAALKLGRTANLNAFLFPDWIQINELMILVGCYRICICRQLQTCTPSMMEIGNKQTNLLTNVLEKTHFIGACHVQYLYSLLYQMHFTCSIVPAGHTTLVKYKLYQLQTNVSLMKL